VLSQSKSKHHYARGLAAILVSGALILAACGDDDSDKRAASTAAGPQTEAEAHPDADNHQATAEPSAPTSESATPESAPSPSAPAASAAGAANGAAAPTASGAAPSSPGAPRSAAGTKSPKSPTGTPGAQNQGSASGAGSGGAGGTPGAAPGAAPAPGAGAAPAPPGSLGNSDTGVTGTEIKLGSISSQSAAMSKIIAAPVTKAALATIASINDNGGVLGRKLTLNDCDDAGDIARFRACYRKLVHQDKIFSLVTSMTFGSGEVHGDLAKDRLPWIGDIGWYGSSWTDPWMIPMYFSAVADASAMSEFVVDQIKPKKVGVLYLNTAEMKAAAEEVKRVLGSHGIEVAKMLSQELDTPDESSNVLQMRQAGVDHIMHFTWPPPIVKFLIDAAQQGYYPEKGVSGNHMVIEAVPGLVGKWPLNRWWSSNTYKVWGSEYEAITRKYAPGLTTYHHHNTQTAYIAMRLLKEAAQEVGPNLTRDALMKVFESREWDAGPGMDQRFLWAPDKHDTLRCLYVHKYTSMEEGSFKVWTPAEGKFKYCGGVEQRPLAGKR
jgi:ABC-type branched-subunit amino acid transport system substrate-binding protein